MVDKYENLGNRQTRIGRRGRVKFVIDHMGEFNPAIPDEHFDLVFSISVLENVPLSRLEVFFGDCARVLKPGGQMLHVVDSCAFDSADYQTPQALAWRERTLKYLAFTDRPDLGLRFLDPPSISEEPSFSCRYISLSDESMYQVQRHAPDPKRVIGQRISLIAGWEIPCRENGKDI